MTSGVIKTMSPLDRRVRLQRSLPVRVFLVTFVPNLLLGLLAFFVHHRLRYPVVILVVFLPLLLAFIPYWFFLLLNMLERPLYEWFAQCITRAMLWLSALLSLVSCAFWLLALMNAARLLL